MGRDEVSGFLHDYNKINTVHLTTNYWVDDKIYV